MSPKNKTVICLALPDCQIENRDANSSHRVQENRSFFEIAGTVKKIITTSFNFTFSTTSEEVERVLKAVLELMTTETKP